MQRGYKYKTVLFVTATKELLGIYNKMQHIDINSDSIEHLMGNHNGFYQQTMLTKQSFQSDETSLSLSSTYPTSNLTQNNSDELVYPFNTYSNENGNANVSSSPFQSEDGGNGSVIWNTGYKMIGYPSGYTTAEVYLISAATVLIMAAIIIGNLLVIIAIFFEYSLQCVQNWFVASLALADLAIGVLIMPFSLSQEVVGYWLFGQAWCQIYSALDVLLCTASILNITLISLDRYWSITCAVQVCYMN